MKRRRPRRVVRVHANPQRDYDLPLDRHDWVALRSAAERAGVMPEEYAWRAVQRALGLPDRPPPHGWAMRHGKGLRLRFNDTEVSFFAQPEMGPELWMAGVVRHAAGMRPSWSPQEDALLRRVYRTEDSRRVLAWLPGRTHEAIRKRVEQLEIPRELPAGHVFMNEAARRAGVSDELLRRLLAEAMVPIRKLTGKSSGDAKRYGFVSMRDVERVVKRYLAMLHATETVPEAAVRLGVSKASMYKYLRAAGWKQPRGGMAVRIDPALANRAYEIFSAKRNLGESGESVAAAAAARGVSGYVLRSQLLKNGWDPGAKDARARVSPEMADRAVEMINARRR